MVLWRISRHLDLSGIGGLRARGRWHDAGRPLVYLSENPALALLEICTHTATADVPSKFILLRVEGPDQSVSTVTGDDLPEGWTKKFEVTRLLGANWLVSNATVLLRVPSAIVPYSANFLLNPLHPDARTFRITESISYPFDVRIKP